MPIHPLKGMALAVVRTRREQLSRRQTVVAEVADGGHIELPVDWTDRGAPWVTPRLAGREVKLCARGLLALARAVDAALGQKVGPLASGCSACAEAESTSQTAEASGRHLAGGVGRTDFDDATRRARHVGKLAAQDAGFKRGRR